MANPNQNRGPWCVVCGAEMNRPNHRFQVRFDDDAGYMARRFHGEVLAGFDPVCGETCLQKAQGRWAQGQSISGDSQADGVKE